MHAPARIAVAQLAVAVLCGFAGDTADLGQPPGQPLPGLNETQIGRFLLGKAVFERRVPDEGLAPLFNAERCSA